MTKVQSTPWLAWLRQCVGHLVSLVAPLHSSGRLLYTVLVGVGCWHLQWPMIPRGGSLYCTALLYTCCTAAHMLHTCCTHAALHTGNSAAWPAHSEYIEPLYQPDTLTHTRAPTHTHLHTRTYTHSPTHTHLHTLTYTHAPTHTRLYTHAPTHTHLHSRTYTYSPTDTYLLLSYYSYIYYNTGVDTHWSVWVLYCVDTELWTKASKIYVLIEIQIIRDFRPVSTLLQGKKLIMNIRNMLKY